jgi:hypothetical protein
MMKVFAAVEQGLGGYTSDIQTGTTQGGFPVFAGVHIDTGGAQTQLCCPDCCHVTTGATSDNNYIKFLSHVQIS